MTKPSHILIFEPKSVGHHLSWLRYITEDFLEAGYRITLAIDDRKEIRSRIAADRPGLMNEVRVLPAFDQNGKFRNGGKVNAIAACFSESGASDVLMPNFDDIASHCMRFAAFGIYPPKILKTKLSGIYFRPRHLAEPAKYRIKRVGFKRLIQNGWLRHIYLLDEYLFESVKQKNGRDPFCLLPDPWCGNFHRKKDESRTALGIPQNKFVFLSYGIPSRRKGLHVAINVMQTLTAESGLYLLCAGQVPDDREIRSGLDQLEKRGMALVMDRYVSDDEEKLCFCASDVVLLPYIRHFGSSGVLSNAAAAGKMVIASDFGLIAKRVKDHNLGWLFPSENTSALKRVMEMASMLTPSEMEGFSASARQYARQCSREAFRKAILQPFSAGPSAHGAPTR